AGFQAGGVDYVTKPFDLDEVVARINTHLALHAMRKRIEAQNAQLKHEIAMREQFEAADRLKDEFLAMLSHELRTPLTAILGWAQLLRRGGLDAATVQRGIAVIERNSWVELKIVEDLLDVSAIIRGKMDISAQPVCLAPVIQSAIDSVKPAAE